MLARGRDGWHPFTAWRSLWIPGAMAKKPSELDVMKEVDVATISQRLSKPSLANGWTLVGDLGITTTVAPMLSIVFARALQPDWYRQLPDSDVEFIFPELFHGLLYGLCWLLGGLALGAFETKAVNPKNLLETIQRTAWAAVATVWLACSAWLVLRANGWLPDSYAALGYVTSAAFLPTFRDFFIDLQFEVWCLIAWRLTRAVSVEGSGLYAEGKRSDTGLIDKGLILVALVLYGIRKHACLHGRIHTDKILHASFLCVT
ncbi:mcb [Symbiodinium necroappetens]|uniref:Mcb protein n=1 Tax=Symbiodinium necroappetens TaxID=1628268 RepID=A0A812NSJ1_9DINO|nr:mcb [Symbiodinium necroappetens]